MASQTSLRWHIEELDFSKIATACARDDDNLFYLAACASFIESGADLYTSNLVDYFRDDAEVFDWLRTQ